MDKLSTPTIENDRVIAAAELEAVSDTPANGLSPGRLYFEDLIQQHYEETQTADRLLKAAENEYSPPQPLTPTGYYDNDLSYLSDGDSDLVRLAEQEGRDSLLVSGSLSPTLYYETPVATTASQGSSGTAIAEDTTIVPSLSGEKKDIFSRVVELAIDGKKAIVHEHLLCEISGFFRRSSCQNTSRTPLSFSVRDYVSDIAWDTLMVFVKWVYFNELYDNVGFKEHPPNWDELLDLYFIAENWEIVVLKNLLLDVLAGRIQWDFYFHGSCTRKIWSNTAPGAPLRRLWVDFYRYGANEVDFRDEINLDLLDPDFLKELSLSFIVGIEGRIDWDEIPFLTDSSIYHVADDVTGTCCCRVRFEGDEYTHKFQYQRARGPQQLRQQINSLEGQVKSSEKKAESLQLLISGKVLDEEEFEARDSKVKELGDQLAKLKDSKLKSEQRLNMRIRQLEASLDFTRNLPRASNARKRWGRHKKKRTVICAAGSPNF